MSSNLSHTVAKDGIESRCSRPTDSERNQLSFAQQRLWFLGQLRGASEAYHISSALRLVGSLDRIALRKALDRIVQRHETLRTTFSCLDGAPVQCIADAEAGRFELHEHDWRGRGDWRQELERLAADEPRKAFDFETGPLIRGQLIRMADEEHALLITIHHIVSDGWSMGVLVEEFVTLYSAFCEGRADPLPRLDVQYADFASWQRRVVDGEALQRQAEYWRTALSGAPPLLELPRDHGRPAQQDYSGGFAKIELDEELTRKLKALSRRHSATLYMTLLGAWAALLGRLSCQRDMIIGTPTANRGSSEIQGLIGFFVNSLALRLDLSGSPTVRELLERVKRQVIAALQHQDIPFEKVVEIVQPPRSLSHSPIFQVMFQWQNTPLGELSLPSLKVEQVRAASSGQTAKFDLTLSLYEAQDRIAGGIEYASSLFERATIERYRAYFCKLLEAMVRDETQAVERIGILDESERRHLLYGWNQTGKVYPEDRCIHELIEEQVERSPEATAVAFEGERLSYAELNRKANQLAHYLRELGVKPDSLVAICAERSLEIVVALLAVLKAGGAYVPLDPAYPPERLSNMVNNAAPVAVLTHASVTKGQHRAWLERLNEQVPMLVLSEQPAVWSDHPSGNLDRHEVGLSPRHLAYVIHTSGSTGTPNGAMNEHRGLVNRIAWMQSAYGLEAHDSVLQKTSCGFDVSVWEFLWPLVSGARLVMARPLGHKDPSYLLEVLLKERISTLHFVPSMLQIFLSYLFDLGISQSLSLARIVCSGEVLSAHLVQRCRELLPGVAVYNLYGPTEAAIDVTAWTCPEAITAGSIIPIGRPIANTQVYILDEGCEPVPVGVTGELYIGGAGVARGYLRRPELTEQRFLLDPFAAEPGARMYRTGDLGRWLADGNIEFLGRNDFQVKVRGFRIELGEIEARLHEHPGVGEAVVIAREDAAGEKRLVAYYTAGSRGESAGAEQLRAHLSAVLPEHMVPAAYVRLHELPRTPNGKLDRHSLPAPEISPGPGYEPPQGRIESELAQIWAELLQLERVGRHDDFFALGGHSLLGMRLVVRLRQSLGLDAKIADLFEHPVLFDLAHSLKGAKRAFLPPITRVDRSKRLPLSYAQQRLWFLAQMDGGSEAYHLTFGLHLAGDLDPIALRRALDRIVARHELLRTTFGFEEGAPVQRIAPIEESRFHLIEHDLRKDVNWKSAVVRLAAAEARVPFDFERGPLNLWSAHQADRPESCAADYHASCSLGRLVNWRAASRIHDLIQGVSPWAPRPVTGATDSAC